MRARHPIEEVGNRHTQNVRDPLQPARTRASGGGPASDTFDYEVLPNRSVIVRRKDGTTAQFRNWGQFWEARQAGKITP